MNQIVLFTGKKTLNGTTTEVKYVGHFQKKSPWVDDICSVVKEETISGKDSKTKSEQIFEGKLSDAYFKVDKERYRLYNEEGFQGELGEFYRHLAEYIRDVINSELP